MKVIKMERIIICIGVFLLPALIVIATIIGYNVRDRHRGYHVDIRIEAPEDTVVYAGFSAIPVTPEITDTWTDYKRNYRYRPDEGDTYDDVTGSGRFDAVWMARILTSRLRKFPL